MSVSQNSVDPKLRATSLVMAVGVGIAVANIYYCQPLLGIMAQSFRVSEHRAGWIATLVQIGTALGMLLFVPLGDIVERRALTVRMCICVALGAVLIAVAPSFALLGLFSFLLGLGSVVPHLVLPFAAQLAPDGSRGKVVGTVISGLLVGILLSRTVAGFLGASLGWRAMYWISAVLMVALAVVFRRMLPESHPKVRMRYSELLRSVASMVAEHPILRESALIGALLFAAFSVFWTTLVFFLARPPYHYGARMAGALGLLAAASAALAPIVGRLIDRRSAKIGVSIAVLMTITSFVALALVGHWLVGLGLGVILLDVGVQTGHISNQTRIYNTFPQARSRANTVYMVTYFTGGAIGSSIGTLAWNYAGWSGVCIAGAVLLLPALLLVRNMRDERTVSMKEAELTAV